MLSTLGCEAVAGLSDLKHADYSVILDLFYYFFL
jgi:hypothetical protein